jgi:hypothetical protein
LYTSPNIIRVIISRRMKWAGHVARMGEMRNAYNILFGRPRHRWEDNIIMEIEWEGVDWMHLAQDRDRWRALVNTVSSFWVP